MKKRINKSIAVLYENVFYVGHFENVTLALNLKLNKILNILREPRTTELTIIFFY